MLSREQATKVCGLPYATTVLRTTNCAWGAQVAQGKAEEGLLVARRVHELADRLLPRGHAMSVRTGLRLWDVLTFCGQVGGALGAACTWVRLAEASRRCCCCCPRPPLGYHAQHQPAEVLATSLHTLLDRIHNHKRDTTALSSTAGTPSLHHTASSVHSRASYGGALTSPGLAMAGTGSAGAPTAGGGAAPEGAPGASGSSFGLDMGTTEVDLAAAQIALGSSLLQARKCVGRQARAQGVSRRACSVERRAAQRACLAALLIECCGRRVQG